MSWKACLRSTDRPISAHEIAMAIPSKDPDYETVPHYVAVHAHGGGDSEGFNGDANQAFTYTTRNDGSNTVIEWSAQNPDLPVSFVVVEGTDGTYGYLYDCETCDAGLAVPGALQSIAFGYASRTAQPAASPTAAVTAARICRKWAFLATGEKVCVAWA